MKTVYEVNFGHINNTGIDEQYEFENICFASESYDDAKAHFEKCCEIMRNEWWTEYETSGHKNAEGRYYELSAWLCDNSWNDFQCFDELEWVETLDMAAYTIEDASVEKNDSIFVVNKGLYKSNSIE